MDVVSEQGLPKFVGKKIRELVFGMAEELVRKMIHGQVTGPFGKLLKRMALPGLGSKKPEKEVPEDKFGFAVKAGGYKKYKKGRPSGGGIADFVSKVIDPKMQKKLASMGGEVSPFLKSYVKAANDARKAWLVAGGDAAIAACNGKPKLLAQVEVPVFDFQTRGLMAATVALKAKLQKFGGDLAGKADMFVPHVDDRSTDIRREFGKLAQELVVKIAKDTIFPQLEEAIGNLKPKPFGPVKDKVTKMVQELAESNVRAGVAKQIKEFYRDMIGKMQNVVPGLGIVPEPGEEQKEDKYGFLVAKGGYKAFKDGDDDSGLKAAAMGHARGLIDPKISKKLDKQVEVIVPFLNAYSKGALKAHAKWMKKEGNAAMQEALVAAEGVPDALASVMVPIADFQKAGLIVGIKKVQPKMAKMGGLAGERAAAAALDASLHSMVLRRDFSQMLQQFVADTAEVTVFPELDKTIAKKKIPNIGPMKGLVVEVKTAVYGLANEIVRKQIHAQVLTVMEEAQTTMQATIDGCTVIAEEGEVQEEDGFGFVVADGGFVAFREAQIGAVLAIAAGGGAAAALTSRGRRKGKRRKKAEQDAEAGGGDSTYDASIMDAAEPEPEPEILRFGNCRQCTNDLRVFDESHPCFGADNPWSSQATVVAADGSADAAPAELSANDSTDAAPAELLKLAEFSCSVCSGRFQPDAKLFCCDTYTECDWRACRDCQEMLDAQTHVEKVLVEKVLKRSNAATAKAVEKQLLPLYTNAAKQEFKKWLNAEGQEHIDSAKADGGSAQVPIADLQKKALMAACLQLKTDMIATGGKARDRAEAAVLTVRQHSTDLRREFDLMVQQAMVQDGGAHMYADVKKKIRKLGLAKTEKKMKRSVKRTCQLQVEESARKELHSMVLQAFEDTAAMMLPEGTISDPEPGEEQPTDEYGFLVSEGGFLAFRGRMKPLDHWLDLQHVVDTVLDRKAVRRLEKMKDLAKPVYDEYEKTATAMQKLWLRDGHQQAIQEAEAQGKLQGILVPIPTFQIDGMVVAGEKLRSRMVKMGGVAEMRAKESTLTSNHEKMHQIRSTDVRREFSQLVQQMAMDESRSKIFPTLDKTIQELVIPPAAPRDYMQQIKAAVYEAAEEVVRMACHRQVLQIHHDVKRAAKIDRCSVVEEEGEPQDEDDYGFLDSEGGFAGFKLLSARINRYNGMGKSHLKQALARHGLDTSGTKTELLQRLLHNDADLHSVAEIEAAELAAIQTELQDKERAMELMRSVRPEFADYKAPQLREELAKRGKDSDGNKAALLERLADALQHEEDWHAYALPDEELGACRQCCEGLHTYNNKHPNFHEFGVLNDWQCSGCKRHFDHAVPMFCCFTYNVCGFGVCGDCQHLPDPIIHTDDVLDEETVKKMEKTVDSLLSATLLECRQAAAKQEKRWLKGGGAEEIKTTKKRNKEKAKDIPPGTVMVPVASFQIAGLGAAGETLRSKMIKMGGMAQMRANSSVLAPRQSEASEMMRKAELDAVRSTTLRREVSQLAQQMSMDEVRKKFFPGMRKTLRKIEHPEGTPESFNEQIWTIVADDVEELVRERCNRKVRKTYKQVRKDTRPKDTETCRVMKEAGEAQDEDEFGFIEDEGGFKAFKDASMQLQRSYDKYSGMGKSHLKKALSNHGLDTKGSKSELLQRVLAHHAGDAALNADELEAIRQEEQAKAKAHQRLFAARASFAELKAPELRIELHNRDLDTSGKKAALMMRLAQAVEAETEMAKRDAIISAAVGKDVELGQCRVCRETLLLYNSKHPCYGEIGLLDDWGCDVCGETFGQENALFCCATFHVCDWGGCVKCQGLPDPKAHVDDVIDAQSLMKLERMVNIASTALDYCKEVALEEQKQWLKSEGSATIKVAKKQQSKSDKKRKMKLVVPVPIGSFQRAGLVAASQRILPKMVKLGGVAEMRAAASMLNQSEAELDALVPEMHSTDARRELSQLIQQMAVDEARARVFPDLDIALKQMELPVSKYVEPKEFKEQVRFAVYAAAEDVVRKECHKKLLLVYKETAKETRVKNCTVAIDEGGVVAEEEDEYGFLDSEGGYAEFQLANHRVALYAHLGKSHLKNALKSMALDTTGSKSELLQRLLKHDSAAEEQELADIFDAEEEAAIEREMAEKEAALEHLRKSRTEYAELKAPGLRDELERRGLDISGKKAVLMERLAQAIDDEIAAAAIVAGSYGKEDDSTEDLGVCRVCSESLEIYSEEHPCFEDFGALDDWGCDVCGNTYGQEVPLFCCKTFNVCDFATCTDCKLLPNPHVHIDGILDITARRKLEQVANAGSSALGTYKKTALVAQKQWLKEGAQKTISKAKKEKSLDSVLVPVANFQVSGLLLAGEQLRSKMIKMGGIAGMRATDAVLTNEMHSILLRREISQLVQQMAVDQMYAASVVATMDKQLETHQLPESSPADFREQVKAALHETAEAIVRKEAHRLVILTWSEVEKATGVKGCGVMVEGVGDDGNANADADPDVDGDDGDVSDDENEEEDVYDEDEYGCSVASGGYSDAKSEMVEVRAKYDLYSRMGKSHLKRALKQQRLETQGSKSDLLQRLLRDGKHIEKPTSWAEASEAEETAAEVALENEQKDVALEHLRQVRPEFAEVNKKQLREELSKRGKDTAGKKAVLMERLAKSLEELGLCSECQQGLHVYNAVHPCFGELGVIDDWDCDVCGKTFDENEPLYCCDTFDACDWGACSECQGLVREATMGLSDRVKGGWLSLGKSPQLRLCPTRQQLRQEPEDWNVDHLKDDLEHVLATRMSINAMQVPPRHSHASSRLDKESKSTKDAAALFKSQVENILHKKHRHSTWVMDTVLKDLDSSSLASVFEANAMDPAFGFVPPPTTIALTHRMQGGHAPAVPSDDIGETVVTPAAKKPIGQPQPASLHVVQTTLQRVDSYLESQGLVRIGVENTPHVSAFRKAQLESKLRLSRRVRGGDDDIAPADEEAPDAGTQARSAEAVQSVEKAAPTDEEVPEGAAGSEGGEAGEAEEEEEPELMALSEEDQAIMAAEVECDKELLKAQSGNNQCVKLFSQLADDLLDKVDIKIDPKKMKAIEAIELFCGVICDLVYVQVALVLCPQIMQTIKNIKYTPEGEDVALVLPTVMKNMLQGAVDDMIEGKVREQVEKLVKAAIATAAKLFKKTVPGIPTLGNDADDDADDGLAEDTAEDDEVEAAEGEGGAKGEGTEVDAEGRPITLEEGIERYDEEDAQVGVGTAAIALAAGGGAALALGVSAKDEDGDANPTVQVLDEATIGMVLYSVSCLEPILKAYTKRAHVEQREWFGHTGKDELKAFNKTEKKKKKKERGKVKYQMPVHTFQEIGKETPLFAPFIYKMHHFTKTGSGQT
eukprot:COSAG06_NODE_605_length_13878_cov_13.424995_3_plen_3355_part_00